MVLRIGSKGKQVAELQKLLKERGFFNHPSITETFGPVTEAAVKAFQKSAKLKDDGVVGRNTWDALSTKVVTLTPVTSGGKDEDFEDDDVIDISKLPKIDGKYPTSSSAIELVKFIKGFDLKRKINKIVWHCTASHQTNTTKQIIDYHLKTKKWSRPGYHIIIDARGEWTYATDFNLASNGVSGHNSDSINISYIGGIDRNVKAIDNRTPEQRAVMELIYHSLVNKIPKAKHYGHYFFANKACPSYNVENWIKEMTK
jgi:N-acetylmuramoyl-L-alanine amidase